MNPQLTLAESRRSGLARLGGVIILLVGMVGLSPRAWAQAGAPPGGAAPPQVKFTVTEASSKAQMINVPVNQGVLVDFNVPIREVRVASSEIADVTATAPQQVLVNGKSYGTTQLLVLLDGGTQHVFTVAVDLDLARLQASIDAAVPRARVKATGSSS